MSQPFFESVERIRHQGPDTDEPLAFRWYDPDRTVLGKRMEDQLRCAVCMWHTFAWPGSDVFGAGSFGRPWHAEAADPQAQASRQLQLASR